MQQYHDQKYKIYIFHQYHKHDQNKELHHQLDGMMLTSRTLFKKEQISDVLIRGYQINRNGSVVCVGTPCKARTTTPKKDQSQQNTHIMVYNNDNNKQQVIYTLETTNEMGKTLRNH